MADTKRQRIVSAIVQRFQGILIANGYMTDLGNNVEEWRSNALPEGNSDHLTVKDPACNSEAQTISLNSLLHEHTLDVELSMRTATAAELTPAELRKMSGDIIKAIGVDPTWGGLAFDSRPDSDQFSIEQADKIIGNVLFKFKVVFETKAWNPFE